MRKCQYDIRRLRMLDFTTSPRLRGAKYSPRIPWICMSECLVWNRCIGTQIQCRDTSKYSTHGITCVLPRNVSLVSSQDV
jgi:hypothetical protein